MSLRRFIFPFLFAAPVLAVAQKPVVFKEPRILLLVDGSSSMLQNWSGKENRFQTASRLIESLMDSMYRINPNVEFGLRLYGHQSPAGENNCYDTKREVMFSKNNRDQMSLRLAALHPYGVSPIAYSLQRAAEDDLTEEHHYSYSIILLTDGGESCGGDLCAISKLMEQRAIFFKPYIISMVDYAPLKKQYECLGEYLTVGKQEQMKPAIQTILDAYRPVLRALSETPVEAPRPKPVVEAPRPVARVETPPVVPPAPPVVQPTEARRLMALLPFRKPEILLPVKLSTPPLPASRTVPRLSLPEKMAEPTVVVAPPAPKPAPPVVPPVETPFTATLLPFRNPEIRLPVKLPAPPAPAIVLVPKVPLPERIADAPVAIPLLAPLLAFQTHYTLPTGGFQTPALPRVRLIPVLKRPAPEEVPVDIEPLTFILRRNRIYEMASPVFAARTLSVPRLALPKAIEDPKPTVVAAPPPPKPKPVVPPKPQTPTPVEFNARTERSTASGLLVFFTDGKGKYYKSTPQIEVRESNSGNLVKKFFRTVNASGEPDVQTLPPGTYDVVVTGRSNVMARRIPIGVDERMNLQMVVTNGSLRFSYTDNPNRPVSEFSASVVRRFADEHNIVRQKANEEIFYEPGNYYLELNTLPVTRRNLDIDFGGVTEIQIAEPGWVQFTNTSAIAEKVVLYQPLGDGFASFLKMDITGDLETQKIRLQPGTYEARWMKGPAGSLPTTVRFQVMSNQTTMTELK